MIREGIYVGGKEIVERYIGEKKVWFKKSFEAIGSYRCSVEVDNSRRLLTVSGLTALQYGIYYIDSSDENEYIKLNYGIQKIRFEPRFALYGFETDEAFKKAKKIWDGKTKFITFYRKV